MKRKIIRHMVQHARQTTKNKFLLGMLVLLAITLPATILLVRQQQSTKQQAQVAPIYTYIRQSAYSGDATKSWFRDCLVEPTSGAVLSRCTPWSGQNDLSNLRGTGGGESYTAFGAFVFSKNGVQTVRQTLINNNTIFFNGITFNRGQVYFRRDCPIDPNNGINFNACEPWPTTPIGLRFLRGVGNESYGGYSAFTLFKNNVEYMRESYIDLNGVDSYSRDCPMGPGGPDMNACAWNGSGSLTSTVPQNVGGTYGSISGTTYFQNGQRLFRQVLVTANGFASYVRVCAMNNTIGIDFNNCPGGWQNNPQPQTILNGALNTSYGSYEEFTYTLTRNLFPDLPKYSPRIGSLRLGAGGIQTYQMSDAAFTSALTGFGFRSLTPGVALKMAATESSQGTFSFGEADTIVNFATNNGLYIRGHALIWDYNNPAWLNNGTFTRDQLIAIMKTYIQTVVTRYKGKIREWDVVNEAVGSNGSYRPSKWLQVIGPDYIDLAFQFAHEADPNAKLYYNDFEFDTGGVKFDAIYNLVKGLRDRGVPVSGVGMQMHVTLTNYQPQSLIASYMSRLAALGVEVAMTEVDVSIQADPGSTTQLAQQADVYKMLAQTCYQAPNCMSFTTWGLYDGYSWLKVLYPTIPEAPLLLDKQYHPKPAYYALAPYISTIVNPTTAVPTATPIPVLPPPTGLTVSCPAPGTQAHLSWNAVSGATSYPLRIDDQSNGWDGSCNALTGDFCGTITTTSLNFTTTPGHTYTWWVHALSPTAGLSGQATGTQFTCTPSSPTVTRTPTIVPTNPPTATPISVCRIQGYKVVMPGNQPIAPAASQKVTVGSLSLTSNPYAFANLPAGTYTISVPPLTGYQIGYTACTNGGACHTNPPINGTSVTVNCPKDGFIDLWWHYTLSIGGLPSLTPTRTLTPTKTPTPQLTATPTRAATPTRTPTPGASVTPTRTPGITAVPATPVPPTPTIQAGSTTLSLTLFLHGIGKGGDNVNTAGGGNMKPNRLQRQLTVEIFNASNTLVLTKTGIVTFSGANGNFSGVIDLGATLPTGSYTAKLSMQQFLKKIVPGILTVTSGQMTTIAPIYLVNGDVNSDNRLNVLDYNTILDCFSGIEAPRNCADATKKQMTDINDDGSVNEFDYNLFLRELSVQAGN